MLHLQGCTCTSLVSTLFPMRAHFQPTLTGVPTILTGADGAGTVEEGAASDAESVPDKVHFR